MQLELRTMTAEETREVGEAIAGLLRPGDAIALTFVALFGFRFYVAPLFD